MVLTYDLKNMHRCLHQFKTHESCKHAKVLTYQITTSYDPQISNPGKTDKDHAKLPLLVYITPFSAVSERLW
jgi:hypothetical protein